MTKKKTAPTRIVGNPVKLGGIEEWEQTQQNENKRAEVSKQWVSCNLHKTQDLQISKFEKNSTSGAHRKPKRAGRLRVKGKPGSRLTPETRFVSRAGAQIVWKSGNCCKCRIFRVSKWRRGSDNNADAAKRKKCRAAGSCDPDTVSIIAQPRAVFCACA